MKGSKNGTWDYAPAPESTDHVNIKKEYGHFIDGKFVKGSGKSFATIDPATETKLAMISGGSEKDVDKAVKAARKAYNGAWGNMPAKERGKYIYRIARLIQERARELAVLESLDGGKPIRESRGCRCSYCRQPFLLLRWLGR